jgi:hypothetical protein
MGSAYVVGTKPRKKPKHVCNKECKKNGCKENRGNNAGGEPQYLADSMKGLGHI